MPRYRVTVSATCSGTADVEVVAANEDEACTAAKEKVDDGIVDIDFDTWSPDEIEVDNCIRLYGKGDEDEEESEPLPEDQRLRALGYVELPFMEMVTA